MNSLIKTQDEKLAVVELYASIGPIRSHQVVVSLCRTDASGCFLSHSFQLCLTLGIRS
jgi:hypothetical protein